MKTRKDALEFALTFPDSYQDAPFNDDNWQFVSDSPSKRIYEAVKKIPKGHVATYAQIAELSTQRASCPVHLRSVGLTSRHAVCAKMGLKYMMEEWTFENIR